MTDLKTGKAIPRKVHVFDERIRGDHTQVGSGGPPRRSIVADSQANARAGRQFDDARKCGDQFVFVQCALASRSER